MFPPETVPTGQPGTEYPLSYGQQRLWFLHRLDPGDSAYNTSYVYRLKGLLDKIALAAAFTAVAARHESLRTRFREVAGEPVAIVEPPSPVTVERLTAQDEQETAALVSALTNTAFDLAAAPPFRVSLIELGPAEHVLCVVLHHINGDGWSMNVLRSEVATHYGSRGTAPLPELPLQYGEYARAQRPRTPSSAGGPNDWPGCLPWSSRRTGRAPPGGPARAPRSTSGSRPTWPPRSAPSPAEPGAHRSWCCSPPTRS